MTDDEYQRFTNSLKNPFGYNSSRHHYIPVFYLNGFTNERGLMFVYDKLKNIIREVSPKSAFYEWDRNTFHDKEDNKMSLLEDVLYGRIDDACAPLLAKFRDEPTDENLINDENIVGLWFFIMNLFWRVSKMDSVFDRYFDSAKITFFDEDGNEIEDNELLARYKADKEMKKGYKAGMFSDTIDRVVKSNDVSGSNRVFGFTGDMFLLGDFPFIYRRTPSTLEDVILNELFLPISSKRIYSSSAKCCGLTGEKALVVNSMIIEEAVRYVCSPNKEHLKNCIEYHSILKREDSLLYLKHKLFL